jgi:pimeloyl-ACP methyl ester carboxylesterase
MYDAAVHAIHRESIDLPSGRFALLRAGSGSRLLVLLHGFPDHPPTFVRLIERLAEAGYDVVAPWLRGYAPSTLAGPYHIDRIAQDALELASALGHERFALVGHDWGAIACYVACALAPDRISAAVALSIPHPFCFRQPRQLALSAYMPVLAAPGGADLARAHDFRLVDLLWRKWSPSLSLDASSRRALHDCLAESWPAPARYYRALFWPPTPQRFGPRLKLEVPLLHLHGAEDGCVSAQTGAGQARFFRGPFRSETLPGAGHFLALEAPDWVARQTSAWLALHDTRLGEEALHAG